MPVALYTQEEHFHGEILSLV